MVAFRLRNVCQLFYCFVRDLIGAALGIGIPNETSSRSSLLSHPVSFLIMDTPSRDRQNLKYQGPGLLWLSCNTTSPDRRIRLSLHLFSLLASCGHCPVEAGYI